MGKVRTKRGALWCVGAGAVIAAVSGVGIVALSEAHPGLIRCSTRITAAPVWTHQEIISYCQRMPRFFWRSSDEILEIVPPTSQGTARPQAHAATGARAAVPAAGDSVCAWLVDARTGVRRPFDRLNLAFQRANPIGEMHLSPDGRWLLWKGRLPLAPVPEHLARSDPRRSRSYRRRHSMRLIATELDGPRQFESRESTMLTWLPDSRRWVQLTWTGDTDSNLLLQLQGLNAPMPVTCRVTGIPPLSTDKLSGLPGNSRALYFRPVGVTRDNRLLAALPPGRLSEWSAAQCLFYDMALSAGGVSRQYQVSLPLGFGMAEAVLSADGERIAWTLRGARISKPAELLRLLRLLPQYGRPKPVVGLWVSRRDGSDMQEIGEEQMTVKLRGTSPYDVRWSPDGERLSFAFDGALYAVRVPK